MNRLSIYERFAQKIRVAENGCWLWTGAAYKTGYGRMRFGQKTHMPHRVSYELHVGPIPVGMAICHRCDDPRCCAPHHLFHGTRGDNNRDRDQKGRRAPMPDNRGERNVFAKLTESGVLEIRASVGERAAALARRLGVSRQIVNNVRARRTWRHVA